MRSCAHLWWTCVWLTACSDARLLLIAPDLPADATRVALVVIGSNGRIIESTGLLPADSVAQIPVEAIRSDVSRVVVVAYRDGNLERLTLPDEETLAGTPVAIDADTTAPLPSPDWVGSGLAIDDPVVVETTQDPIVVTAAWAPRCARSACERYPYEVDPIRIEFEVGTFSRQFAVAWDQDATSAFVGTSSSTYRITPGASADEVVEIDLLGAQSIRGTPSEAVLLADGRMALMVLTAQGSELWVGRPETGVVRGAEPVVGADGGAPLGRLATAPPGAAPELFLALREGPLYHWVGGEWQHWYDAPVAKVDQAHAAWAGPGEVVLCHEAADQVTFLKDGRVIEEVPLRPVGVIERLPSFGWIALGAATDPGNQMWHIGDDYRVEELKLEGLPGSVGIWILSDTQALLTGVNGELSVFEPALGNCELPRREIDKVLDSVQLEQGLLTITSREMSERPSNFVNFYPKRTDEILPACILDAP